MTVHDQPNGHGPFVSCNVQNVDNEGYRTPSFEDDTKTNEVIAWWGNKTNSSLEYPLGFEPRVSCTKDGFDGLEK